MKSLLKQLMLLKTLMTIYRGDVMTNSNMKEDLYILICERDTYEPEDGRPIVFEQYLDKGCASLERIKSFRKLIGDSYGKTWIAKLEFIDE